MRSNTLQLAAASVLALLVHADASDVTEYPPGHVTGNDNSVSEIRSEAISLLENVKNQSAQSSIKSSDPKIEIQGGDDGTVYSITIEDRKLNDTELETIARPVCKFVALRNQGHSRAYATFIVGGLNEKYIPSAESGMVKVMALQADIAYPWIRRDIKRVIALPGTKLDKREEFCLIDGELGWLCIVRTGSQGKPYLVTYCFDAIEVQPGTSSVFESGYEELVRGGIAPSAGKPKEVSWWYEFQRYLLEKHGIRWRPPTDLNPEKIFD